MIHFAYFVSHNRACVFIFHMIHSSFIHSSGATLTCSVAVDLERTLVHHRTLCTHTFTPRGNFKQPIHSIPVFGMKPLQIQTHETHTERNLNSGSDQRQWSCEEAKLFSQWDDSQVSSGCLEQKTFLRTSENK